MRGRFKLDKKGLSPVVASVLLVALTIVIAGIIFIWAKGFIDANISKGGEKIENLCNAVDYDVARIENTDEIEVINRGNINIYHLDIKMYDSDGNSEVGKFKFNIDAGSSKTGEIYLYMKDGSRPEKITVYPALIGTVEGKPVNRIFTCTEVGKTLIL